jgi:phosphate acetyltransferase
MTITKWKHYYTKNPITYSSIFPLHPMIFLDTLFTKASSLKRTIAFPDALDERTLHAARILADKAIAQPLLVGAAADIHTLATKCNVSLDGIVIRDPATSEHLKGFAEKFYELRKAKGLSQDKALETVKNPLYFAAMMLRESIVDACVGGSLSATGDILRTAIQAVGTAPGIATVSSFFLMLFPDKIFAFGDCAVVPAPTPPQLADIALATATNFTRLTGEEPRVAMLSFSTKGSAEHECVAKVREGLEIAKGRNPNLIIDGELQFDAAFVPSIGERKAPGSPVAGRANVYIFPDLNAGNIGYKITERLGGAQAVGPVVQGLAKPYLDLSRGCSVEDIVATAAIAALMA